MAVRAAIESCAPRRSQAAARASASAASRPARTRPHRSTSQAMPTLTSNESNSVVRTPGLPGIGRPTKLRCSREPPPVAVTLGRRSAPAIRASARAAARRAAAASRSWLLARASPISSSRRASLKESRQELGEGAVCDGVLQASRTSSSGSGSSSGAPLRQPATKAAAMATTASRKLARLMTKPRLSRRARACPRTGTARGRRRLPRDPRRCTCPSTTPRAASPPTSRGTCSRAA